jgi:predicted O-methyltransferase YrrM
VLYPEAVEFNKELMKKGEQVMSSLPVKMGLGGNCLLLYFLARYLKPRTIVETGVSMGFSSQTFLSAIRKNGEGRLYSSDFPYFRISNPKQYIGCMVDEDLKKDWILYLDGDGKNLPLISSQLEHVDLFHYDSDKSYTGREMALRILKQKIDEQSLVVFDDIGDNFHFKELAERSQKPFYILQHSDTSFVGVLGNASEMRKS